MVCRIWFQAFTCTRDEALSTWSLGTNLYEIQIEKSQVSFWFYFEKMYLRMLSENCDYLTWISSLSLSVCVERSQSYQSHNLTQLRFIAISFTVAQLITTRWRITWHYIYSSGMYNTRVCTINPEKFTRRQIQKFDMFDDYQFKLYHLYYITSIMPTFGLYCSYGHVHCILIPDSKIHGANMGPAWVMSAPGGPHVGPINLAIRDDINVVKRMKFGHWYHVFWKEVFDNEGGAWR